MTSAHTPGPWFCTDWQIGDEKRPQWSIASSTDQVAIVPLYVNRAKEWAANARLIVAAPDMLAALGLFMLAREMHDPATYRTALGEVERVARAAIAKATGTPSNFPAP